MEQLVPGNTDPVDFELKEDANPICSEPYTVTKVHEEMF